jgi:hypothetical protein
VIPQLKRLAPQDKFIGPVTYHYDQQYLSAFLQHAQPLPDGVSWHEYTCTANDTKSLCLAHIADWSNHIAAARSITIRLIGRALPVLITEWNYAANPTTDDGKSNDSAFMSTWTKQAMQTLIENHVFASLQYSSVNTAAPLIGSNNQLTAQGTAFQQQYEQFINAARRSTPTPTVTVRPTTKVSTSPTPNAPATGPSPVPTPMPTPSPMPVIPTPPPAPAVPTPSPMPTKPASPTPVVSTSNIAITLNGQAVPLNNGQATVVVNGQLAILQLNGTELSLTDGQSTVLDTLNSTSPSTGVINGQTVTITAQNNVFKITTNG